MTNKNETEETLRVKGYDSNLEIETLKRKLKCLGRIIGRYGTERW